MASPQLIDVDVDPADARRVTRRRLLRVGLPLMGVLLIVVTIVAIVVFAQHQNRVGVLQLADDLISSLEQRIRTEVESYLEPAAATAAEVAALIAGSGLSEDGPFVIERFANAVLAAQPQIPAIFVSGPNGAFLMVRRTSEQTLQTKLIDPGPPDRRVLLKGRDPAGRITSIEEDPDDQFDPRSRPWYRGAIAAQGVHWTDAYVFFTDRAPGITASLAQREPNSGDLVAVAGVDIRLAALSEFLTTLKIGERGRALIVDAEGRLVAYPDQKLLVEEVNGILQPRRLDDLGDPVMRELYDRIRVAGPGRSVVTVDEQRYVVAASSLAEMLGREWSLVITVPEEDFVGFVVANSRTTLFLSLGVIALSVGLAMMLTRQGLVADRTAAALQRREQALVAQSSAYEELATTASLFDAHDSTALARITESVAHAVAARRVSLWQVEADLSGIVCADCFDRETDGHTSGAEILREECPALFAALVSGEDILADEAAADPRTASLASIYLQRVGCRALLSVPIVNQGGIAGFVWLEDDTVASHGVVDATSFVRTIAHMIALRFRSAVPRTEAGAISGAGSARPVARAAGFGLSAPPQAFRTTSIAAERREVQLRQLNARGVAAERLLASIFADVTVLVLRFNDDLAIAASTEADARMAVIEQIVDAFQTIAERYQIRYVKILNEQIVAAAGFDRDAHVAAAAMAEVALELQRACSSTFEQLGPTLDYAIGLDTGDYAIGLDTGTVIGSAVGFAQMTYNVWGEAVRVAQTMAMTARPGTVQVSEATYDQLRGRFVLRRRGGYYLERVGEMTTYTLRGRL